MFSLDNRSVISLHFFPMRIFVIGSDANLSYGFLCTKSIVIFDFELQTQILQILFFNVRDGVPLKWKEK